MSSELIGIIILVIFALGEIGLLLYVRYDVKRGIQEQLRRNLALETAFQKWNAEKLDSLSHRFDQVLEMLRRGEI